MTGGPGAHTCLCTGALSKLATPLLKSLITVESTVDRCWCRDSPKWNTVNQSETSARLTVTVGLSLDRLHCRHLCRRRPAVWRRKLLSNYRWLSEAHRKKLSMDQRWDSLCGRGFGTMLEVDDSFMTIWLSRLSEVRVKVRRWPQSPIGTIFLNNDIMWLLFIFQLIGDMSP